MPGVHQSSGSLENIEHAKTLFTLAIVGPILAVLLVANRLVFRFRITGGMGLDDWTITAATAFLFAQCAATVAAVSYGYGRHTKAVAVEDVRKALFCFWILQIFYKLTINTVKLSILALYGRVFYFHNKLTWICVYAFIFIFAAELAFLIGTILQCWPIRSYWDHSIIDRACNSIWSFWWSNAIWNILSDAFLLLLPIPVITKLQITLAKKIGLTCMFSIGIIVLITAILRFTTLRKAAWDAKYDPLSGSLTSTTWTTAEASLAVICANIPMLRQLLEMCVPAIRKSLHSASRSTDATIVSRQRQSESFREPSADSTLEDNASVHCLVSCKGRPSIPKGPDRVYDAGEGASGELSRT